MSSLVCETCTIAMMVGVAQLSAMGVVSTQIVQLHVVSSTLRAACCLQVRCKEKRREEKREWWWVFCCTVPCLQLHSGCATLQASIIGGDCHMWQWHRYYNVGWALFGVESTSQWVLTHGNHLFIRVWLWVWLSSGVQCMMCHHMVCTLSLVFFLFLATWVLESCFLQSGVRRLLTLCWKCMLFIGAKQRSTMWWIENSCWLALPLAIGAYGVISLGWWVQCICHLPMYTAVPAVLLHLVWVWSGTSSTVHYLSWSGGTWCINVT